MRTITRFLRRFLILLIVFVMGVAGTAFLMNNETTDDRSDMNNPTLPEVMVDFNGTLANRMYGYRQPMEADFVRDSVTPLDTTKKLTIAVNPYEEKIKSLSYEVRTSDGTKIVENRKVKSLDSSGSDGYLRAQIEISSGLLMNQEYSLQISLDTSDGEAYYYTRVVSRSSTMIQVKNNRNRRIFCIFLYSICNIFCTDFFIFQSSILEICSSAHKSICKVCTLKNRCGTEHLMNFNRCFCLSYCIYIKSALSKVIFIYSFQ